MTMLCFRHKGRGCPCVSEENRAMDKTSPVSGQYTPTKVLITRRSALEVYYACVAFPDNIGYKPEAYMALAQAYITVADLLATRANGPMLQKALKEAGFEPDKA